MFYFLPYVEIFLSRKSLHFTHSLIFRGRRKKKTALEKKTPISLTHSIFAEKWSKMNFSGKKKYDTFGITLLSKKKIKKCSQNFKKAAPRLCFWGTLFYFKHNFSKTDVHIVILKIKSQLPNLTSNFNTHKNVGGNFLSHVYVGIYLIYISTKYEEF